MQRFVVRLTLATAVVAMAAAMPGSIAAATETFHSRGSASYTVDHDCGIVEATTVTVHETDFFDDGAWVRSLVHFDFKGIYTGPSGATYAAESHQNGTFTPTTGTVNGQGSFLRGAGGVLLMDVGHLRFDIRTGETLRASAKVIRFDDPNAPNLDATLCAKLGS